MKFSDIIEHLGFRGFATRKRWNGCSVVFFGMDNIFKASNGCLKTTETYSPCLADILADDWDIIDCYWGEKTDSGFDTNDFKPYDLQLLKTINR